MLRFMLILIIPIAVLDCGSAPRFISEEEGTDRRERIEGGRDTQSSGEEKVFEEPAASYDEFKEYSSMPALETDIGVASYYAAKFQGKRTAGGEVYDKNKLSAAHLNYPFGTIVRVTNEKNGISVILKINDRLGTYNGRVIDISHKAAGLLGMIKDGIAKVKIEVLKWGTK